MARIKWRSISGCPLGTVKDAADGSWPPFMHWYFCVQNSVREQTADSDLDELGTVEQFARFCCLYELRQNLKRSELQLYLILLFSSIFP